MAVTSIFKLAQVQTLYKLLDKDLKAVEQEIERVLREKALPSSDTFINYVLDAKGKMLRPILVLLSAYSHNGDEKKGDYHKNLIKIAAAIEIIHMASLLHDDVIDEANERRGKPSINAKYGNGVAVTMGVLLYSASLELIAETKNTDVLSTLSASVREMCEGELLQYDIRHRFSYSEDDYFKVIYAKTGTLFKAACLSGGLISNASDDELKQLEAFAVATGTAFQLSDDYLDLFGSKESLDKELGQDYIQGQLTLPLIYALDALDSAQKEEILNYIQEKDLKGLDLLKDSIRNNGVKERIFDTLQEYNQKAHQSLANFSENNYVNGLHFLSDYILQRVS